MLIAAQIKEIINGIVNYIKALFKLKKIGEICCFLGFNIVKNRINKKVYII